MGDDYFGYTTAGNKQLTDLKIMGHHMGEDVTHYPPPDNGGKYVEPTKDWNDPKYFGNQDYNRDRSRDTIEMIWKRMNDQDAGVMYQLADQWFRVLRVIEDIRERVKNAALGLKNGGDGSSGNHSGWKGKGAEAFLARGPGATLKSLDDWKAAAYANWMGTLTLAQTVPDHQLKINTLFEEYKKDMVAEHTKQMGRWGMAGMPVSKLDEDQKKEYVAGLREHEEQWNGQAREIQYGMAKHYWSVMSSELNGGSATIYEGPGNAVMPDPKFLAQIMAPPMPTITKPNIGSPNISKPNVSTNSLTSLTSKSNLDKPNITAPTVDPEALPDPAVKPDLTAPTVTPPTVAPPVVPPVPVGKQPFGLRGSPVLAPSVDPALRNAPNNLLNNMPGQGKSVSGLLGRQAPNPGQVPNTGTPSLPQSPMKGQPGAPPQAPMKGKPPSSQQFKGRGQVQRPGAPEGAPGAPPNPGRGAPGVPSNGRGQRAPGEPSPGTPRSGLTGQPNPFGGPPSSASSPVLRAPGSPQASGNGQRRGGPGSPGVGQSPSAGVPGTGSPLRPGATPPVLNRPKPSKPVAAPPPSSLLPPTARNSDFAPPSMPTSRPVVGRSTRPVAGPEQERASGVLRGNRRAKAGYEAQIGSRRKGGGEEEKRSIVDEEYAKIRQLLDQEEAWTVATPGGGVLDSAPTRPVTATTEPKPTLGA